MNSLGLHLLLELRDCDKLILDNVEYIKESMVGAAREAGATILGENFYKFSPVGVTGVVLVSESHLCIHTWPEYGYAAVDIFTCGDSFRLHQAAQFIIKRLRCLASDITEVERGRINEVASSTVPFG